MIARNFVDQMGRSVRIPLEAKRIISLVPSQTELLHDLGLTHEVVGVTKFCVHPESWFRVKQRVGGTKQLNIELIRSLKPDLIIGNKEENTKEDIEELSNEFPVWMSDISTFDDALAMIEVVGDLVDRRDEAEYLVEEITEAYVQLGDLGKQKTFLYFIWDEPAFVTGKNTFIDSMITKLGFKNACELDRYPALSDCPNLQPDVVFLSSEPYPFKEIHRQKFQEMFPKSAIRFIDGEMCSWYGSRMLLSAGYFEQEFSNAPLDL